MGKSTTSARVALLALGVTIRPMLSGCSPRAVRQGSNALAPTTDNSPSSQDGQDEEAAKLLELELIGCQNDLNGFRITGCKDAAGPVDKRRPLFPIAGQSTRERRRKGAPTLGTAFDDLGYSPRYIGSAKTEADSEPSGFREKYGVDTVPYLLGLDRSGHHAVAETNYRADGPSIEIETAIKPAAGIESAQRGLFSVAP